MTTWPTSWARSSICSTGRVRLNAAAFYTDFKNRPTHDRRRRGDCSISNLNVVAGNQQLIALPGGPPGSTQCSTQTLPGNTGITCIGRTYYRNLPANVRGAELEYTVTPTRALMINGSVGWSKFWSPDIAARTVNQAPEQSVLDRQRRRPVRVHGGAARRHDHAASRLDLRKQPDRQRHVHQVQLPDAGALDVQRPRHATTTPSTTSRSRRA